MAFSQGISGLGVAAANLDVIGNNIANSGTVGFKSAAATFQDVYAGSRVGLGASVSGDAELLAGRDPVEQPPAGRGHPQRRRLLPPEQPQR